MLFMNYKDRESQIELLRIVSIWLIVFYHLFMDFSLPLQEEYPLYKGLQIPLHIGVLLFVLISGYFGIKASIKGFDTQTYLQVYVYVTLCHGSLQVSLFTSVIYNRCLLAPIIFIC